MQGLRCSWHVLSTAAWAVTTAAALSAFPAGLTVTGGLCGCAGHACLSRCHLPLVLRRLTITAVSSLAAVATGASFTNLCPLALCFT